MQQQTISTIREALEAERVRWIDKITTVDLDDKDTDDDEAMLEIVREVARIDAAIADLEREGEGVTWWVVLEWLDGHTRVPIAVCATEAEANAMVNAFRDVEKVERTTTPQPDKEAE